jgi:uncharacterized membrane-anchored protein YjiN (DUF445 family)
VRAGLTDAERRADLRRMKAFATGLLLVAALVFVVTRLAEQAGAPAWVGYLNAAAEAGMVGGLADWFAVTALFRRPLGLPIPHTALIPTKKDQLGESLSDFVGENFLSADVVRDKLARADLAGRLGVWLRQEPNALRVTSELAALTRGSLGVLRDDEVRSTVEFAIMRRLAMMEPGPPLGRLLSGIVTDGGHHKAVDLLVVNAHEWLLANRWAVVSQVAAQAPGWAPKLVNDAVASKVYAELVRVAGQVRDDPDHPFRKTVDRYLHELAHDLQHDPPTRQRARDLMTRLLAQPEVRQAFGDAWAAARRMFGEMVDDPDSELRLRVTQALRDLGVRLVEDPGLRSKVDSWAQDAAVHVVGNYRREITAIISDTVDRWDGEETARRVELQVGRDLQFIRVNGFVVGALAGVVIHAVAQLL